MGYRIRSELISVLLFIVNALSGDIADITSKEVCPRIRKPWLDLSTTERELYISGLLKIREKSHFNPDIDEFLNIAEVHDTAYASLTHDASAYLFWHGYLTWEMESRIRALGGEYACFGMPYWDFTKEIDQDRLEDPMIFYTGIGGNGNPDDCFTVNDYTWDGVSTAQFWIPLHCCAEGDIYPVCSFKRAWSTDPDVITLPDASEWDIDPEVSLIPDAKEIGEGMRDKSRFIDFSEWYQLGIANPVMFLHGVTFEIAPSAISVSFDPIWYLYHSFVEYHRFMWTDCHEYDKIDPSRLDEYPRAYEAYCLHDDCNGAYDPTTMSFDAECLNMALDDAMCFPDLIADKPWSYVYNHDLSIREFYHMTKLNVVYDISRDDEHSFYVNSGMKDYCQDRLNETWWITETDESNNARIESRNLYFLGYDEYMPDYKYCKVLLLIVFVSLAVFAIYSLYRGNAGKSITFDHIKMDQYGTF